MHGGTGMEKYEGRACTGAPDNLVCDLAHVLHNFLWLRGLVQIEGIVEIPELSQDELQDTAMPHATIKCGQTNGGKTLFEAVVKKAVWSQLKADLSSFIELGKEHWR